MDVDFMLSEIAESLVFFSPWPGEMNISRDFLRLLMQPLCSKNTA